MQVDMVHTQVYRRLCEGTIWGVRRDRCALAKAWLFGSEDLEGVVVVELSDPNVYNRLASDVYRVADYPHRFWQPEDFLGGVR